MIKTNLEGCREFFSDSQFRPWLSKAAEARCTLLERSGAGSEFTGWLDTPENVCEEDFASIEAVCRDWHDLGVDLVAVIGIGGSYLGARCAVEALSHGYIRNPDFPRVVFTGNHLSEDCLSELIDLVDCSNVACVVISKSGTTTEPAVAFRILKQRIENRYGKSGASARIVAVTDADKGALKALADKEGYRTFIVPGNVGGRYSVLTPVGLLPIALAGFDIRSMIEGAACERRSLLDSETPDEASRYAAARNMIYSELGKKTEILVSFEPKLQYLGEWWKQLFGESEGKGGKGIFPASLICTTDLHSMGQYVQDGERILFETVLKILRPGRKLEINAEELDLDQLNYLAGKRIGYCNEMALKGTAMAHIQGGVPQLGIEFECIDERNLGALFYFFEFACGISAYMLGVNPFDQPGVEAYKKNMFTLLEKPGYVK